MSETEGKKAMTLRDLDAAYALACRLKATRAQIETLQSLEPYVSVEIRSRSHGARNVQVDVREMTDFLVARREALVDALRKAGVRP